jgi:hypothetical protein
MPEKVKDRRKFLEVPDVQNPIAPPPNRRQIHAENENPPSPD